MPPFASKGKGKGRDPRRSRSRNTTPSSVLSAGTAPITHSATPYLEVDASKLQVPSAPQYSDILDRLDNKPGLPEGKQLELLVDHLRQLSEAAEARANACDTAMREIVDRRKTMADEDRERERVEKEAELRKAKAKRDTEEASDGASSKRGPKPKKRKERSDPLEESIAQPADGVEVKVEGVLIEDVQASFSFPSTTILPTSLAAPPIYEDPISLSSNPQHRPGFLPAISGCSWSSPAFRNTKWAICGQ